MPGDLLFLWGCFSHVNLHHLMGKYKEDTSVLNIPPPCLRKQSYFPNTQDRWPQLKWSTLPLSPQFICLFSGVVPGTWNDQVPVSTGRCPWWKHFSTGHCLYRMCWHALAHIYIPFRIVLHTLIVLTHQRNLSFQVGTVQSIQFSRSVVFDSLRPHESQHARPPCPSPIPGVHSDS